MTHVAQTLILARADIGIGLLMGTSSILKGEGLDWGGRAVGGGEGLGELSSLWVDKGVFPSPNIVTFIEVSAANFYIRRGPFPL